MKKFIFTESQLKTIIDNQLKEEKPQSKDVDERSRSFAFTRKKRLFSKSEMMANPNRYKQYDKEIKDITEDDEEMNKYAVIEITKALAFMEPRYYFQAVPYWHTKENKIFIKKGSSGSKMISTDNIKVLKTFNGGHNNPEMKEYLKKLRETSSNEEN